MFCLASGLFSGEIETYMASYTYRIAQLDDVERVLQFAINMNFPEDPESFENKMMVWDSSYRKESLEHYLKLGWSFVAFDSENKLAGFFLGQALLFVDKQTQTLWVEYVLAVNDEVKTELIDIAYRLSREKHFQRVLLPSELQNEKLTKSLPFQNWGRSTSVFKTTK